MNTTQTTKLVPTFVAADAAAFDTVFDGRRARPVGAFTQDGTPVVCCVRTARKNGWLIASRFFDRKAS